MNGNLQMLYKASKLLWNRRLGKDKTRQDSQMATYQGAMSLFAKHKDVQVALTVLRSRAILVMTRGKERTTGEPQTDPWPRRAVFQPQLCTYNSPSLQAKRGSPRLCPGSLLTPKPHSGYQMCMCVCVCVFVQQS